jgi:hypothetical protein
MCTWCAVDRDLLMANRPRIGASLKAPNLAFECHSKGASALLQAGQMPDINASVEMSTTASSSPSSNPSCLSVCR